MLGKIVGNYRITSQIGEGGMGAVYAAEHLLLGKRTAIKVLLPERSSNKEIVDRFFNEAKATTMIHHPGIVEIFDYGHLDTGSAYIVMEFLDGESLGDRLRRMAPLSIPSAVSIARHIAGTLAAAHTHGIIHRDLKPDNVFLVPDPVLPRGERAKVLDFGIAKLAETEPGMVKTDTGRVMGTPMYMSPEQCRGSGKVDSRSDIYALGCVFYHMLVGRPPFVAEGSGEVLAAHIHLHPRRPSVYLPDLPPDVEQVAMTLLAKDPAQRYQTMDDVIVALNEVAERLGGRDDEVEPSLAQSHKFDPLGRLRSSNTSRDIATMPTTLGQSSGESYTRPGLGRTRWPWFAVGGVIAILAGVLVARELRNRGAEAEATAEASEPAAAEPPDKPAASGPVVQPLAPAPKPEPATPPPSPPPETIDPAPAAEAKSVTVELTIDSRPQGAKVYREADGVKLGTTPLTTRVLRGEGEAVFILRRARYRSERLTASVDQDSQHVVVLEKGKDDPDDPVRAGDGGKGPVETPPPAPVPEPEPEKPAPGRPGRDDALDPFGAKAGK